MKIITRDSIGSLRLAEIGKSLRGVAEEFGLKPPISVINLVRLAELPPPEIKVFKADPNVVSPDTKTTLRWQVLNCENSCTISISAIPPLGPNDPSGTSLNAFGSLQVSVSSNTEYTLNAKFHGKQETSRRTRVTTPRFISVSNEGAGGSAVFIVTGEGFTPNSLVVIKITATNFAQVQFPETADRDGKFISRHSVPCQSGQQLTFTAFEDADPSGTFANAVVTTCP